MEDKGLKVVSDQNDGEDDAPEGVSTVEQILGTIRSDAEITGEPSGNSTRWIFDINHYGGGQIRVQLAFKYQRPKGDLLKSYTLAPLSRGFYDGKVYVEEEVDEDGNETLVFHAAASCSYRVAIDTVHTSTR